MTIADRLARAAWIAGAFGVALCVLGLAIEPARLGFAWLSAVFFWIGLPFGALVLCLTHDLTGGGWGKALRAPLRAAIMTLPAASLALLPILLMLSDLYPWAVQEVGHFYLTPTFFIARSLVYLAIWNGLAALRLLHADSHAAPFLSAIGLIALVLTGSFAAIDWSMSLEAPWSSSVYGLLATTEWVLTGLTAAIAAALCPGLGIARDAPAVKDGSLGKLLLAVLLGAAYLAYMQFLIVWEENLVHEISWYLHRLRTGWAVIAVLIVALEFVVPFLLLLPRSLKRRPTPLGVIALLVLAGRLLETWWLVLPARPGSAIGWLDAAAILAVGGAMAAVLIVRRGVPGMARLSHG